MPEELMVKEVLVNKGSSYKKIRYMGKGRTGVGYIRRTHVTIKVSVIDFEEEIAVAQTFSQKKKWQQRKELVEKLKNSN